MHSFVINVGDAIDMTHYRAYFYEGISEGRQTVYEIENIGELKDISTKVERHINRNAFDIDEYMITVCVSRNQTRMPFSECCDLMLEFSIEKNIWERLEPEKVNLFLLEQETKKITGKEQKRIDELKKHNTFLWHNGYLSEDAKNEWPTEDLFEIDRLALKEIPEHIHKCSGNGPFSQFAEETGMRYYQLVCEYADNNDGEENRLRGREVFRKFYTDAYEGLKAKIERHIDPVVVPIETYDLEECIAKQLRLVCYINDKRYTEEHSVFREVTLKEDYDSYHFSVEEEASRIAANRRNLEDKKKEAEQFEQEKDFRYRYKTKEFLAELRDEDILGNETDIDRLFKMLVTEDDNEDWDDRYIAVVRELEQYEEKLESFSDELLEQYYREEQFEETALDVDPDEKLEQLKESEALAAADIFQAGEMHEAQYGDKLKLANEIEKIRAKIRKIKNIQRYDRWRRFLPAFTAAVFSMLLPYLIMQPYVVDGVIGGNIVPIVCVAVFLLAFLSAKVLIALRWNIEMRKAREELKSVLKVFFASLEKRQRMFIKRTNAIITMQNIQSEKKQIQAELEERKDVYKRLVYHRDALESHLKALSYFNSLIDEGEEKRISGGYSNDFIKGLNTGVEENDIYWMKEVE